MFGKTNSVMTGTGGSGNGGGGNGGSDTLWVENPSELEVSAGDKVLVNYVDVETSVKTKATYSSNIYGSMAVSLPNKDIIRYNQYFKYDATTNSWTGYTVTFPINDFTFVPFRQGNVVMARESYSEKYYYYDYSLGANGSLGLFYACFLWTAGAGYFRTGYAIKSDSYYNINLYPWSGSYSYESILTNSSSYKIFDVDTTGMKKIKWLNVIGSKIFVCRDADTHIIDVTHFPNCTKTVVTHDTSTAPSSSDIYCIGCTGDNDGDYDLRWFSTTTISVMRKVNGTWIHSSLPLLNYRMYRAPTYEPQGKILTCVAYLGHRVRMYKFNDVSKEFEEIVLPEEINTFFDNYIFYTDMAYRPMVYYGEHIGISLDTRFSVNGSLQNAFIRALTQSKGGQWTLVNDSFENYYSTHSLIGYATGEVDEDGRVEVSTLLAPEVSMTFNVTPEPTSVTYKGTKA